MPFDYTTAVKSHHLLAILTNVHKTTQTKMCYSIVHSTSAVYCVAEGQVLWVFRRCSGQGPHLALTGDPRVFLELRQDP